MTDLSLYLYNSFQIEPVDNDAVEIKRNINLNDLTKHPNILKNEQVVDLFKKKREYCLSNSATYDVYYIEYTEKIYNIKILFYKINNYESLTTNIIHNYYSKDILTLINRTINLQYNLISEYDNYFNIELDNILKKLSETRFYDLSLINIYDAKKNINYPINDILNIPLFDYQKDNINWMLNLESNPIRDYISGDKIIFFPDGRIYNYTKNHFVTNEERELVQFKGGLILDNVGIGKTVQLLCLALSKTDLNTLIIVPDHLQSHWEEQFKKHFSIDLPKFINIIKFSEVIAYNFINIDRVIIDEIHELYSNPEYIDIFEALLCTGCKYKWGISATPFPVENSIFNLIKFLTEKELYYYNLDRYNYFFETYFKIFRKNTLDNIYKEIKLPECIENNLLLDFNEHEKMLYEAETMANNRCDIQFLRKCCCDIMINYDIKNNIISLNDFNNVILEDYRLKYFEEVNKLKILNEALDKCLGKISNLNEKNETNNNIIIINNNKDDEEIEEIEEIDENEKNNYGNENTIVNVKELEINAEFYKNKIIIQEINVNDRKQAYEFLKSKINDTNKVCPICLSEITDGIKYDVPNCGHICCTECLTFWLINNSTCTVCKKNIEKEKNYTITNLEQIKLKYSTKIDKILEIISKTDNTNEKFIIYTQFDNMILKLYQILNSENIGCLKLDEIEKINEFKNNLEKRVLILSSIRNASGIDLSFVSNIIIFEPIIGNTLYLKDIEKQIIGRIYRINQTKNINIFRLIIRDTIEEECYNKTL